MSNQGGMCKRAGEIPPCIMSLLLDRKDLSLIPSAYVKSCMATHMYNFKANRGRKRQVDFHSSKAASIVNE